MGAHPGGGEAVEGLDLGGLPQRFLLMLAVARALFHGAGAAAVAHLAALLVLDGLAEAALVGFLVDLGAAGVPTAADEVDSGFLAAFELA